MIGLLLTLMLLPGICAQAAEAVPPQELNKSELPPGYVARVNLNEPAEVQAILNRAQDYFDRQGLASSFPPVVMVLHGPEIAMFTRNNYHRFQAAADLAAKLTALKVIDVRICETRMAMDGIEKMDLLPFVGTVPFGPAEESRLTDDEEFVYF